MYALFYASIAVFTFAVFFRIFRIPVVSRLMEVSWKIDHLLVVNSVCLVKIHFCWCLQSHVVRLDLRFEKVFELLVEGW